MENTDMMTMTMMMMMTRMTIDDISTTFTTSMINHTGLTFSPYSNMKIYETPLLRYLTTVPLSLSLI